MTCWRNTRFQAPPTSDGTTCVGRIVTTFQRTAVDGLLLVVLRLAAEHVSGPKPSVWPPRYELHAELASAHPHSEYPTMDDVRITKNERVRFTQSTSSLVEGPVISFARQATTRSGQAISFFRGYQPTVYSAARSVDSHVTDQQVGTRNLLLSEP
jgi:hypothetical protein